MKFNTWTLEPSKYLTGREAERLLRVARYRAEWAESHHQKIAIRDYFLIHLALATGLRVMEMAALQCGDVCLNNKLCSILVRKGKGGKRRLVLFAGAFQKHCIKYFQWKQDVGESLQPEAPLIVLSNTGGHMTTRAIQKIFKKYARRAKLYANYSIHSLRHTYASLLLKASHNNLRLVQKQLGHARITTTQVYADVMLPDTKRALDRMPV